MTPHVQDAPQRAQYKVIFDASPYLSTLHSMQTLPQEALGAYTAITTYSLLHRT